MREKLTSNEIKIKALITSKFASYTPGAGNIWFVGGTNASSKGDELAPGPEDSCTPSAVVTVRCH